MQVLLIASIMMLLQIEGKPSSLKEDTSDTIPIFREEQVSFDSTGNLMEITKEEAYRLEVFQDISGFLKATVCKTSPAEYTIEMQYREKDKIYKSDSTLSESDFRDFQATIDRLLLTHPKMDRSGWGLFLLGQFQVAFSEWAYLTVSLMSEGTSGEVKFATYLLTASSGFFLPLYLTIDKSITLAQARLSYSWAHQGYLTGFVLRDLTNWHEYDDYWDGYDRSYSASMLAGSILGSWTGYSFADKHNLSAGKSDLMSWAGYWGAGYAATTTALLIPWEGSSDDELRWKIKLCELSGLLGLGYGNYLWYSKSKDVYTFGDAFAYRTFTVLSALTSVNIVSYLFWEDVDNEWLGKTYIATGMALNGIGFWNGLKLFEPIDLTFVDGIATTGGAIAGSLVGSALAILSKPDGKVAFSMTLAGGWGGYLLTYNLISKGKGASGSLGFQLYPENLAALWISKAQNRPLSIPIATFKF